MPKLVAVFRADASVEIGGGHVRRCLVLAKALMQDGWAVYFVSGGGTQETVPQLAKSGIQMIPIDNTKDAMVKLHAVLPDGCDLLVVDHYGLDDKFESSCRSWARLILVIDDLANRRHDCDIVVDQTFGRQPADYRFLVPSSCSILVGSNYALLDQRFENTREKVQCRNGTVRRILVSLGATDPKGASVLVLAALQRTKLPVQVDVVIGAANPFQAEVRAAAEQLSRPGIVHIEVEDMAALINCADLVIGAGGVSALERCCLGVPSILVILAENQRGNADALSKAGAALVVDEAQLRKTGAFAATIRALVQDKARLAAMSIAAKKITDGLGARRVQGFFYASSKLVGSGNKGSRRV